MKPPKICYFQIDGPERRQSIAHGCRGIADIHALIDYAEHMVRRRSQEIVELPRIRFQAELTFVRVYDKRIIMADRFGLPWSVYAGDLDALIPAMTKGVVEAWWTIVKRGSMYGLNVDLETPLGVVVPDRDVPLMLNTAHDLRALYAPFSAMAT